MTTNLPVIFSASYFQSSKTKFSDPLKFPENSITRPRFVKSYELELYLHDGGISYLNGIGYSRKKGAIILALPNDKRQSTLHFDSIILRFETQDPMLQRFLYSVKGFHYTMDFDTSYSFFQDICELTNHLKIDNDIRATAKLLLFLCDLKNTIPEVANNATNPNIYSAVNNATNYMKEHYAENIHITDIASFCCLSNSYFHKAFFDVMHVTPNDYLLNLRLSQAKTLLITTQKSISEIAILCGFNSLSYFSACFKKTFSYSPKDFRISLSYPDE